MKKLQKQFTGKGQVKGFTFTQIKQNEVGYIYKVETGVNTHYEVFEHKENTLYNCVSYPTNKAFGKWAWTCGSLYRAIEILEDINLSKKV